MTWLLVLFTRDMFVFVMGIYVDVSSAYFMVVPVVNCNELTKANHKGNNVLSQGYKLSAV